MALIQALLSLITRSAGKILNAIFGWAVVALFGQTTPTQKTLLSGLVGLAAAWPLLVAGVFMPRIATAVLAFVPPSAQGPSWIMRAIWLALALAVPIIVGLAVAAKAPPGSPAEPFVVKMLRGFPITLGLAAAFLVTFLTVPFMRLGAAARRRTDEHVPLVTSADIYDEVAAHIDHVVRAHHIDVLRAEPPWWLSAPTRILMALGGKAFRGFVPARLAYWNGPRMEIALYPSDLLLRGVPRLTAWTHGLLVEDLVRTRALQTFDPAAQEIEQQIRRVWRVYEENPDAHRGSEALSRRLREITEDLGGVDVEYEEWSILYRQCAQLSRALDGKPQMLAKEDDMADEKDVKVVRVAENRVVAPEEASSARLVAEAAKEAVALVRAEFELARSELVEDLRSEVKAAKGLSVAAVCALMTLSLLLMAAVFGLANVMPNWGAALVVAGIVAALGGIAGAFGWKHFRMPLERTRKTLKEDVRWVKERVA